jgi:hypothetical protein
MSVAEPGKPISGVEVANVSPDGFWLVLGAEQLFVSFASFPWFRDATIAQIANVEMPSVRHLYWPDLDIDLSVESIRDPGAFPLVSRAGA